jgi:hypothetical protein
MPLPKPREGETQDEFVSRFMSNEVAKREFPDQKQRLAVAYSTWRKKSGRKLSSVSLDEDYEHEEDLVENAIKTLEEE